MFFRNFFGMVTHNSSIGTAIGREIGCSSQEAAEESITVMQVRSSYKARELLGLKLLVVEHFPLLPNLSFQSIKISVALAQGRSPLSEQRGGFTASHVVGKLKIGGIIRI